MIKVWPSRRRARTLVAVTTVAVVLGAGTAAWWLYRPFSAGPLSLGDNATETAFPIDVGETATFGGLVLRNSGGRTATIDAVELTPDGDAGSARIVDVRLTRLAGGLVGTDDEYQPPADALPPDGAVLPPSRRPRDGYQILFGIQMVREGIARYRHVRVDYHVGLARYRLNGPHSFILCAPATVACRP